MKQNKKLKEIFFKLIILLLFLKLNNQIFSKIIITEFSLLNNTGIEGEAWVEIFNSGSQAININGWGISDLSGTDTPFIKKDLILEQNDFAIIHFKSKINNRYKNFSDSENLQTGKMYNNYWDLYTDNTVPNLNYGFTFLVLTKTPGNMERSLLEVQDLICIYDKKGIVKKNKINILNELLKRKLWCANSVYQNFHFNETLTNYDPYSTDLPLYYPGNNLTGYRKLQDYKFIDTDSHKDWSFSTLGNITPGFKPGNKLKRRLKISNKIFNPETGNKLIIFFSCSGASSIYLSIHDILGREKKILINNKIKTGLVYTEWNGSGDNQQRLPTGIYIIKLIEINKYTGELSKTLKPVILNRINK